MPLSIYDFETLTIEQLESLIVRSRQRIAHLSFDLSVETRGGEEMELEKNP